MKPPGSDSSTLRVWLYRAASIIVVLLLFALVEGLCAILGWGDPAKAADPYVGFRSTRPLFLPEPGTGSLRTAPYRLIFFPDQSFPRRKPAKTFRIFCFGGSTVQGNPYAEDTSFPTWLRLSLEACDPARNWEVINCGGISYASYRLANIVDECLGYEPDLFILCSGHNEFLEDRSYARLDQRPGWLAAAHNAASHLRIFNLMQAAWGRLRSPAPDGARQPTWKRTILKDDVDAWLDYEGGLKVYHRDEAWRAGVIEHFRFNIRRMVRTSQNAGVPILLVNPTSNLRDCPPFKSQHRDGLSEDDKARWVALTREASRTGDTAPAQALAALRALREIDDQYALTAFQLGKVHEALGQTNEARAAYLQARELDVCPLRILAPMEQAIRAIAEETGVPLIDAQRLIERRSVNGIPGDDWLLDHVHPTIKGHQLIADALLTEMVKHGWVTRQPGWETWRDQAYSKHLASLPADYYEEGQKALAGLSAWTQGRSSGPPIEYWLLGRRTGGR